MRCKIEKYSKGFQTGGRKSECVDINIPESDMALGFETSFAMTKGKAKKLSERIARVLGYELVAKKAKVCPKCGSHAVTMFTSDDDICGDCGKYFPAVGAKDLSII